MAVGVITSGSDPMLLGVGQTMGNRDVGRDGNLHEEKDVCVGGIVFS